MLQSPRLWKQGCRLMWHHSCRSIWLQEKRPPYLVWHWQDYWVSPRVTHPHPICCYAPQQHPHSVMWKVHGIHTVCSWRMFWWVDNGFQKAEDVWGKLKERLDTEALTHFEQQLGLYSKLEEFLEDHIQVFGKSGGMDGGWGFAFATFRLSVLVF